LARAFKNKELAGEKGSSRISVCKPGDGSKKPQQKEKPLFSLFLKFMPKDYTLPRL